ncbi:hypothetical protein [Paraburkholderia lacunae]|uniref:Uncharacterized protein n=1 Tax=Paraburkholderia lacunae TaxID=2211104 RepID=A0A370N7P8_9BURK|nr:hypothetical protein [Paraburkholderia lacunae]RDK01626.1 hypothetical protein DLM46_17650 [Paraburkholderia lacunae]
MTENRTRAPSGEPIDIKEVVGHVDTASGLLAYAAQSFADTCAIFEAIRAAAAEGSLISRLAQLGINNCETHEGDFTKYCGDYNAHTERFSVALTGNPFRRLHSAEDSLRGGA